MAAARCSLPGLCANFAQIVVATAISGRVVKAAEETLPTMDWYRAWYDGNSEISASELGHWDDVSLDPGSIGCDTGVQSFMPKRVKTSKM